MFRFLTKGAFLIFPIVSFYDQILTEANDNANSDWNPGVDVMTAIRNTLKARIEN